MRLINNGKAHLPDILASHTASLLDIGRALRHVLERVAGDDDLVLLRSRHLDLHTAGHDDLADELLAQEVSDLDLGLVRLGHLVERHVDREMGVHETHLVLVSLRHAGDEVRDERPDGPEGGDALAGAVVHLDLEHILGRVREADGDVAERLLELACEVESDGVSGCRLMLIIVPLWSSVSFDLDFDFDVDFDSQFRQHFGVVLSIRKTYLGVPRR